MRITGKQPIKPSASDDLPILPIEAELGTREFRDALVADNDENAAPPEMAREAREAHEDAINEQKQDKKVSPQPKPRVKTQRPSKEK